MANFPPLKRYILYCLDKLIDQYDLSRPFLDAGCGIGDVSRHVALKGWEGKAIDFSDTAIEKAKQNLAPFKSVEIEKKSLFDITGTFSTIFVMDALEHIDNDEAALEKISSLLLEKGHAVIAVPSNPREWRWDDKLYGHYRRYTIEDLRKKLIDARLEPLVFWDFTYPFFWIMRRIYTRLKPSFRDIEKNKLDRTTASSAVNAWDIPIISNLLSGTCVFWDLIYKMQFTYFKDKVRSGHEMIVLSQKRS